MTLATMRPCAAQLDLPAFWRGPNDPPGTRFRANQTFEIYGYWPRVLVEELRAEIAIIAPELLPTSEPTPTFETCPVLSLIEAQMLVESAIGNRGDWTVDEIRVYVGELRANLDALDASLDAATAFEGWMEREGL